MSTDHDTVEDLLCDLPASPTISSVTSSDLSFENVTSSSLSGNAQKHPTLFASEDMVTIQVCDLRTCNSSGDRTLDRWRIHYSGSPSISLQKTPNSSPNI
jgi:hypothetical protein